jgi:hypothetical protein
MFKWISPLEVVHVIAIALIVGAWLVGDSYPRFQFVAMGIFGGICIGAYWEALHQRWIAQRKVLELSSNLVEINNKVYTRTFLFFLALAFRLLFIGMLVAGILLFFYLLSFFMNNAKGLEWYFMVPLSILFGAIGTAVVVAPIFAFRYLAKYPILSKYQSLLDSVETANKKLTQKTDT